MSDRRPLDLVTKTVALPEVGLGRGWEGPALFGITVLLLSFGLVTLYSASVFMAQQAGLPDHFYVLRQAMGAAVGLVVLVIMVFLAGFGSNMSAAGRLAIPGEFTSLTMRSTALILVVLFLLPGHVSAWLEPVAEERRSRSLGAER